MKTSIVTAASIAALAMFGIAASNAEDAAAPSNPSTTTTVESKAVVPMTTGSYATMQSATDWRSSKVIGLNVYNSNTEKIGDINDLIIGPSGTVTHAIVGVGGFLGIGEKNVAIPFASVKMSRDKDGKLNALVDSTKEALKSAPAFTFFSANT